jgi:hypothetical protein
MMERASTIHLYTSQHPLSRVTGEEKVTLEQNKKNKHMYDFGSAVDLDTTGCFLLLHATKFSQQIQNNLKLTLYHLNKLPSQQHCSRQLLDVHLLSKCQFLPHSMTILTVITSFSMFSS